MTNTVGLHGFLRSGDQFVKIDFPEAIATGAYEITPGGDIVYQDAFLKFHGYLRKAGP